jgi:hypothetical protein
MTMTMMMKKKMMMMTMMNLLKTLQVKQHACVA